MELEDSHKLNNLPAGFAAALHVLPRKDLEQQVKQGKFSTVETCDDDDERVEALHLPELYSKWEDVSGCVVYWDLRSGNLEAPQKTNRAWPLGKKPMRDEELFNE